ncbi:MAG: glycoside hydrolase family 3 N-terminal domain-containing protein [Eubacteriales bacterium]|nr:glycoside hydrolase family 3 N-terminal domain-containing protein [Eubacteriales bacterium]
MEKLRITSPEIQTFETEHIEKVRRMAPECMVLLKNDEVLPIRPGGRLALYGNGARRTIKGGTGSGDVNVRHFVNVEEGLENAGFEITTKEWLDAYDRILAESKRAYFAELRRQADALDVNPLMFAMGKTAPEPDYQLPLEGEGDTAVYVLARISGEGADRLAKEGDIKLTPTEVRDILTLNEKYERFVLVLNVGGMVDLEPVKEQVSAILLMSQPGTPVGDALADVLTGKAYPSGKLAMTWAPINNYASTEGFGDPNDTDYKEGIYVGYRYFDTFSVKNTYPFGYGIGYTTFQTEVEDVAYKDGNISVKAAVTNIGTSAGKEVVQVYYCAPRNGIDKPCKELAGYAKTEELAAGETQTVTITFPVAAMSSYHPERESWILDAGVYYVRVGNSSQVTQLAGGISLKEEVVVETVKKISTAKFEDLKPQQIFECGEEELSERAGLHVIEINPADIACVANVYSEEPEEIPQGETVNWAQVTAKEKTVEDFIAGLDDEQLAYLCIGAYKDAGDILEVIGNASKTVAGAAGETTSRLQETGLPSLVMADGPAGIRISPQYVLEGNETKGGPPAGGDMFLVYSAEELAAMAGADSEKEQDEKQVYYHYCTAIPIGTAIAQSWNDQLAESCGDLAGNEMERFGIHIWLAPALNIQRSPLCGRNFEYFSEDPLLSGMMAAAMTKGVQKHANSAVTIKHYACNNQETNRFFSNSNVSERAMREIYLKGFEICVKKESPHFIMSSYNLINGEHACNCRDILTDVLRDEWGYEGVVMTDWLVTGGMGSRGEKWPCASAAGNIKAGNDLTMPGIPTDKEDIMNALSNADHPYRLTRANLQVCARRILNAILKLA